MVGGRMLPLRTAPVFGEKLGDWQTGDRGINTSY